MKIHRWIWILIAIAVSTTVYFTIRYGLRPKPIPVMNPTSFERLEQIGIVTYKRLRQNIRSERVVLLGLSSDVPGNSEVWLGLLRAAAADKEKVVVFPSRADFQIGMENTFEWVPYSEEADNSGQLLELAHERMKGGHLVVILGSSNEVSHLVAGSLSQKLDRLVGHPVLSISTLPLSLDESEIRLAETECLEPSSEGNPLRRLHCAAIRSGRKFLKKKLDPEKVWAVLERHGLKEYLLFIHQP